MEKKFQNNAEKQDRVIFFHIRTVQHLDVYLFTNWCTSELSYKTILKFTLNFTLKQLRHFSVLQLHHHQGAH